MICLRLECTHCGHTTTIEAPADAVAYVAYCCNDLMSCVGVDDGPCERVTVDEDET